MKTHKLNYESLISLNNVLQQVQDVPTYKLSCRDILNSKIFLIFNLGVHCHYSLHSHFFLSDFKRNKGNTELKF